LSLDPLEACVFRFPVGEGAPLHVLHEFARVTAKRYDGEFVEVKAMTPASIRRRLEAYVVPPAKPAKKKRSPARRRLVRVP